MSLGRLLLVALAAASISMACQSLSFLPSSAADRINLRNDTTTDVAVHVNGGLVGMVGAGQRVDLSILGHGGPPFRIEALSRSGAVLFDFLISTTDYEQVRDGQATMSTGADPGCGWIEVRYGEVDPPGGAELPEAPVGVGAPGGVCP